MTDVIVEELPFVDPLRVFAPLARQPGAVLLDSALPDARRSRYTFMALEPFLTMVARGRAIQLGRRRLSGDPFDVLKQLLAQYRLPRLAGLPPFTGGVAGYWGYELCRHLERVPIAGPDDRGIPDLVIGFFDVVVAFDLHRRRSWIVSSGYPKREPGPRRRRAESRMRRWRHLLAEAAKEHTAAEADGHPMARQVSSSFTRSAYEAAVARVVDAIWDGEIFQANLSQRFSVGLADGTDPFSLYRRLRRCSPAPFAAYLNFNEVALASSSPERFLCLRDGRVETRPIKGTRPRGATPAEDLALAQSLCQSSKDRSENVMIVDLLRNDLSRVCRPHSVAVPELCVIESYANVHHLVSTVTGTLTADNGPIDLLRACFPGGSISGAPKVRAVEIIADLEPVRRGPYCGAIGYVGFDASMDTSVAIRTAVVKDGIATFHAGGGIVAESDPASEYDETLAKASGWLECVGARGPDPVVRQ